jgi:hypothetical protein
MEGSLIWVPTCTCTDSMHNSAICRVAFQGEGQHEEGKEKIAMTSPVTAEMGDDEYKVPPRVCARCTTRICRIDTYLSMCCRLCYPSGAFW